MSVHSPLAAHADEDDEDGDHKGRRCCDGPQEQQVFIGRVLEVCLFAVSHDTRSLLHPLTSTLSSNSATQTFCSGKPAETGGGRKTKQMKEMRDKTKFGREQEMLCGLGLPLAFCHCLFLTFHLLFMTLTENNEQKTEHRTGQEECARWKKCFTNTFFSLLLKKDQMVL